ncbi:hypothetical protein Bbelb_442220, partial [Branchiostoma belcheri]
KQCDKLTRPAGETEAKAMCCTLTSSTVSSSLHSMTLYGPRTDENHMPGTPGFTSRKPLSREHRMGSPGEPRHIASTQKVSACGEREGAAIPHTLVQGQAAIWFNSPLRRRLKGGWKWEGNPNCTCQSWSPTVQAFPRAGRQTVQEFC